MNASDYESTQKPNWILSSIFLIAFLYGLVNVTSNGTNGIVFVSVLFFAVITFYQMRITVKNDRLYLKFGIGLIQLSWSLKNLIRVDHIQAQPYFGFGWRLTPYGHMYAISGNSSLRLTFKNRRSVLIGLNQPEVLTNTLRKYINQ